MSLTPEKPSHYFKPGPSANPQGRPKGSVSRKTSMKTVDRLLGKWHTHPADKLVELARYLTENGKYEEAAAIWTNLLKYFEPTKKPVETAPEKTTPQESKNAADETYKLLQELESGATNKNEEVQESGGLPTGTINSSEVHGPQETENKS